MGNVDSLLLWLLVKMIEFDVLKLLALWTMEFMTVLPHLSEVAICGFRVIFLGHVSVALWVPRSIESILRLVKTTLDLLSLVEVVANSESLIFSTLFLELSLEAQLNRVVLLPARIIKRGLPTRFRDVV